MKKRILPGILSLAMVIALIVSFCIPAFADGGDGNFSIAGVELKDGTTYNIGDLPGLTRGSITLSGSTLTLENVKLEGTSNLHNGVITINNIFNSVTIILKETNEIINNSSDYKYGILAVTDKTVTKAPRLTIKSADDNRGSLIITNGDIYSDFGTISDDMVSPNISIIGCDILVNNDNGYDGIHAEDLTINNSTVSVTARDYGLFSWNNIAISGSKVITNATKPTEDESGEGIFAWGNVTMADSTVTATGSYSGVSAFGGNIDIQSGTLTAESQINNTAAILAEGYGDEDTTDGHIILGTGMSVIKGGVVKGFTEYDGETVAPESVLVSGKDGEYTGASTSVIIGKADTTASSTDTQTSANTSANASITDPSTPKANVAAATIAKAKTPKASIAATGESTIIIPIVATIAVVSIGAITFTLLRKKKVK